MELVHVMHRKASKDERIDFFMTSELYTGEITNCEPHKCDDLTWFDLDTLPDNIVDYVKVAIENYKKGIKYSEFGY